MPILEPFLPRPRIAYFSMEIALAPDIHTYAGGLGVLAGDTARSCADLNLPMVFVTLLTRKGYARQEIDAEGRQIDHPDPWRPEDHAQPLGAIVAVQIDGRNVWVRPWLYELTCPLGTTEPVILLDTDLEQNAPEDRAITDRLYGRGDEYRLRQEIVLGLGGEKALRALGFNISKYHLNEGHAALLTLALLKRYRRESRLPEDPLRYDVDRVRAQCVFTTHTPVEAGHDQFSYDLYHRLLGGFIEADQLKLLAGADHLNMTRLALNLSGYVNGVARRHSETTVKMFPGYKISAVTNGVHAGTWVHPAFASLLDALAPNWSHDPEVLARADQLEDAGVWQAHERVKRELVAMVADRTGVTLDAERPILGFARRMTGYKRPELLFSELERLRAIAARQPFQVVLAGKAHPQDEAGKRHIQNIHRHIRALDGAVPAAFIPNYDLDIARTLTAGCDVWLNTPLPPFEASGTSGMKAALNGVLNLSVLDGWWVEAWIEGVTGWAIGEDDLVAGDDAAELYDKLEQVVLPLFYKDRERWIWMMKQSISKIGYFFNSQRMMRRYATEAYLG
jgi:glycogen phosphorylase